MEHAEYWNKVYQSALSDEDGEPTDPVALDHLATNCTEYVKIRKANESDVAQAFQAIYGLQDRAVLENFLNLVEDPDIIRIIFEIDDTENADLGDPVGLMLAENPHTPKDVLEKLNMIEYEDDYFEDQIRDALMRNPSASYLFT